MKKKSLATLYRMAKEANEADKFENPKRNEAAATKQAVQAELERRDRARRAEDFFFNDPIHGTVTIDTLARFKTIANPNDGNGLCRNPEWQRDMEALTREFTKRKEAHIAAITAVDEKGE